VWSRTANSPARGAPKQLKQKAVDADINAQREPGSQIRDRRGKSSAAKHARRWGATDMHRVTVRLITILLIVLGAYFAASGARGESPVERGKYLVEIMDCTGCHTTGALVGKPEAAKFLAGSMVGFEIPGLGFFYPPNLTPDPETGLGAWSESDIITAVRTGARPDGRELAPIMPWRSYAALSDQDAQALAAYLKSMPAVAHEVPPPTGPSETPPAPYLTLAIPK
jgi:mono/diheme cytochrome c family protein